MSESTRIFKNLLRDGKDLVGAEVGVYKGSHARDMLKHLHLKKLYLVDPYDQYEGYTMMWIEGLSYSKKECFQRLQKWKDKIVYIYKSSKEAAKEIEDESLDFVYIDANHEYEWVKEDWGLWYPKVKKGGLVGGHDYKQKKGVTDWVEMMRDAGEFKIENEGIEWYHWKA